MLEQMIILYNSILLVLLNCGMIHIFVPKRKYRIWVSSLIFLLWIAVVYSELLLSRRELLACQVLTILTDMIFICIMFRIRLLGSLILVSLFHGGLLAVEYLFFVFFLKALDIQPKLLLQDKIFFLFCIKLIFHFILFILIIFIKKMNPERLGYLMTEQDWVHFSVFPIFTIFVLFILYIYYNDYMYEKKCIYIICIAGGMLVMNTSLFKILVNTMKKEARIERDHKMNEKMRQENLLYESMRDHYNFQKKMTHEFKNHISCLMALSREGEYGKMEDYIHSLQVALELRTDFYDVGNQMINTVINTKYQEAKDRGILFVLKANDLSSVQMNDQDLVVLISNLINNAMEASELCERKEIKVKMVCENRQFIFSVLNRHERRPVVINDRFISSKENPECHGIGVENVKDIIKKYNGSYAIKYDDQWFQFSVIIQNEC